MLMSVLKYMILGNNSDISLSQIRSGTRLGILMSRCMCCVIRVYIKHNGG